MRKLVALAGQIVALTIVFAAVAWLADWPRYRQIPEQSAVVKLSFTHGSSRKADCRKRTAEELAKLPPNMRRPVECPRARQPVYVELDVDGRATYRASLPPSGLSGDGPSRVYERFVVPAGPHAIAVRMRDTARAEGFDYAKSADVTLSPDQSFVIDFRPEVDGFAFR
jgi:hypothetical protein